MDLKATVSAIGLYAYGQSRPDSRVYNEYYSFIVEKLQSLDLQPTYISVEGQRYTGKYFKHEGSTHKRLVKSGFSGINSLSILVNPTESDSPSYDGFFIASLVYSDWLEEVLCYVVSNTALFELGTPEFDKLLHECLKLFSWDFGFAFTDKAKSQPDKHILGIDNGHLSPDEETLFITWYNATPEERLSHLRDVYSYNILSKTQIEVRLSSRGSLRRFIEQQPGSSLEEFPDCNMFAWRVEDNAIEATRSKLRSMSLLLCGN